MTTDDLVANLDRAELVAVVKWLAQELSEWIDSESVESGHRLDKHRDATDLVADAVAAVGSSLQEKPK